MNARWFEGGSELLRYAQDWLILNEATNSLVIGHSLAGGPTSEAAVPYYVAVEECGHPVAAAVRSHSARNLVLSEASAEALAELCEAVYTRDPQLRGVNGSANAATAFASLFSARSMRTPSILHRLGVYECRSEPASSVADGQMIDARAEHRELLIQWSQEFARESHEPLTEAEAILWTDIRLLQKRVRLWIHEGEPVSLASTSGETIDLTRISSVYTPSHLRGRGYASALVTSLATEIQAKGRGAYLFTDIENPTSNRIYQRIGFQKVSEFLDYRFSS